MNLGQMMLVIASLGLMGLPALISNRTMLRSNQTENENEFGIPSISLATSVIEALWAIVVPVSRQRYTVQNDVFAAENYSSCAYLKGSISMEVAR